MKIALKFTSNDVGYDFSNIKIITKPRKFFRYFASKVIIFLLLLNPFRCLSNEHSSKSVPINFETIQEDSEVDTDKDGVVDILDYDDDNDGILDINEGFRDVNALKGESIIITVNGAWVLVATSVYVQLPSDLAHGDEFWVPFMGEKYVKAVRIRFENTLTGVKFIQTAAKHTIGNDPDLDTNLNYDFDTGGIVSPIALADTNEGYGVASIEYKDKIIISEYLGSSGKIWVANELDTDNDGLIDSKDTDSDNDGCSDALEAENNMTTVGTLVNGSNGGSSDNLGLQSNNKGIPLPLGTENGEEEIGQQNTKATITSEQLTVSPLNNMSVNSSTNVVVTISASAIKTSTFNLGVPNFSATYGTDTSELISYKWYREDNLNTVVSNSKTLTLNNITKEKSGVYLVKVKSSHNSCIIQEYINITVDGVLGITNNFEGVQNNFDIYPNPSHGNFNIQVNSDLATNVQVALYDITGKQIFTSFEKLIIGKNNMEFDLKVGSGVFFLEIRSKQVNYGSTKLLFD